MSISSDSPLDLGHRGLPLVLGHRGAPLVAPENTLESFSQALSAGVDGLELDLHRTSDGVLVVHHDPAIGVENVSGMTWAEFHRKAPKAPRFQEVLELLAEHPQAYLNIELKHAVPSPDGREDELVRVLRGWDGPAKERTWISSFDPLSLLRLRRLGVEVPLALLAGEEAALELIPCLPIAAVHPLHSLVSEERIREWRARDLRVFVWTVNELELAGRLLALGVDGLIGDDPSLMLAARAAG